MARVLVTGAAGFIGSMVSKLLVHEGQHVTVLDSFDEALYPATEKHNRWRALGELGADTVELNLLDDGLKTIIHEGNFDFVVHLAAMAGLTKSWTNFNHYMNSNLVASQRLAEALSEGSKAKVVNVSTSSVYGSMAIGGESRLPSPASPYGVTKLAAEGILNSYSRESDFSVCHLRYFSVYGPGQRPDMAYRRFIDAALSGGIIQINGSGDQTRTNTYVEDIARWTVNAINKAEAGEIYNLSGSHSVSVNEAVEMIERLTKTSLQRVHSELPAGDQLETNGDPSKARAQRIIDWETPFVEGLERQIDWQRKLTQAQR